MKKTPLYENHLKNNGKIIDFGGWLLPVEYSGIIPEHEAVRNAAGIFDVSHMGEVIVTGEDAEEFIQMIVTNDISTMNAYQIYYSPMCYPGGGVVDDLLIYKYSEDSYLLVVNAANTDKDVEWLQSYVYGKVEVKNVSAEYAQLALQGPDAQRILQKLTDKNLEDIKFFYFCPDVKIEQISAMVSRNGYTGEDGFEIFVAPGDAETLWNKIMEAGKQEGLIPAGLGARDTLRFEVCLPLYGHEIDSATTPLEAGLNYFVKLDKKNFIGKDALVEQKASGLMRRLCAFEMTDRGIPRAGFEVYSGGSRIGRVTTGSYSPTLKNNIGLALMDEPFTAEGTEIEVLVRNKLLKAKIIKKPFYSKRYKNK
jgi:aminomethyltransferase